MNILGLISQLIGIKTLRLTITSYKIEALNVSITITLRALINTIQKKNIHCKSCLLTARNNMYQIMMRMMSFYLVIYFPLTRNDVVLEY